AGDLWRAAARSGAAAGAGPAAPARLPADGALLPARPDALSAAARALPARRRPLLLGRAADLERLPRHADRPRFQEPDLRLPAGPGAGATRLGFRHSARSI